MIRTLPFDLRKSGSLICTLNWFTDPKQQYRNPTARGDNGFITLMSALEQNTTLLHLDLRNNGFSERAVLALEESLPEVSVLQRVDFVWCTNLASAMPLLLAGLRKNTSFFQFHVTDCTPSSVPPTPEEMVRYTGGWIQEMERLEYRNRFLPLIRAPKESLPPHIVWPRALARIARLPDVIFRCCFPNPAWRRLKKEMVRIWRKMPAS
jgi:hypothetical protein